MNLSGTPVQALLNYYGVLPAEIIVISDDFSLKQGVLRLRLGGSSGGHNGLESIITETGTSAFPRLKLGIGPLPPKLDPADFVLSEFTPEENIIMQETHKKAIAVIEDALTVGIETAISRVPSSGSAKQ
jgi:PTH1 family peptidyl-tRNA hydrolase